MSAVRVLTDSTTYLPPELTEALGINIVSLYWDLGSGPVRETDSEGDFGHFFDELESAAEVATTAPPTPEDFAAAYEPLLADGNSVVSVHISSALSETCAAARAAAQKLEAEGEGGERVAVVDSAATAGQLGVVAIAAARVAATGAGADEVLERARQARQEAKQWFLVDTLEYLRRGGRVGTTAAWVGSTLNIKPILTVESEVTAVERVRTRERGIERMIELARRRAAVGADAWFVQHTRAEVDAQRLVERLRAVFGRPPEFVSELGPVVGTYAGPGLIGYGGVPSRFLE